MKSLVVHSGGMDSTVLLYQLIQAGDEVKALSINYGQRHSRELEAARALCAELGVEHRVADMPSFETVNVCIIGVKNPTLLLRKTESYAIVAIG